MSNAVTPKSPQSTCTAGISVIVPIYNAGKHLRQCLDSLMSQAFEDFEVICVDDGSADESAAILDEYAAKDSRIKVVRQENRGTHVARKSGVAATTKEWSLFLDPDDWLSSDALPRLSEIIGRTKSDVVEYNFIFHAQEERVKPAAKSLEKQFNPKPRICNRDEFFSAVFISREIPGHLIGKIVRTKICKKIFGEMSDRRISFQEDLCALYRIIAESNSLEIVAENLYNYRIGDGISYRPKLTAEEFFATFTKFDELADLRRVCAERFPSDSTAAHALKHLEVRMVVASVSQAIERLEQQEDGVEGIRRLRAICSDEVLADACAQWYRLNGAKLAESAHKYGIADLLGDVALRQLDFVWRGHNLRLRTFDQKFAGLDQKLAILEKKFAEQDEKSAGLDKKFTGLCKEFAGLGKKLDGLDEKFAAHNKKIAELQHELLVEREKRIKIEDRLKHPFRTIFRLISKKIKSARNQTKPS